MLKDNPEYASQFARPESGTRCEPWRIEPEFATGPIPLDVDVNGLVAVEAIEEKPEGTRNAGDCWH
jgi:hypothetical protein